MTQPTHVSEIDLVLSHPRSKEFADLRDRAAFMLLTGNGFATMRFFFTQAMSLVVRMHTAAKPSRAAFGAGRSEAEIIACLDLDRHPMVRTVRDYKKRGWRVRQSGHPDVCDRVLLRRGQGRLTVLIDGTVLDQAG